MNDTVTNNKLFINLFSNATIWDFSFQSLYAFSTLAATTLPDLLTNLLNWSMSYRNDVSVDVIKNLVYVEDYFSKINL